MGTVRMVNSQGQVRHFTESVANHAITKRNGWYRQELEPVESIPDAIPTTWQKAKDSVGEIETAGGTTPESLVEKVLEPIVKAAADTLITVNTLEVKSPAPKPKRTRSTSGTKRTRKPAEKKK